MQMLSRNPLDALAEAARSGDGLSDGQALALAGIHDTAALLRVAAALRDAAHGNVISYSRKVFIPLTQLCRDVCHYCTFAQTPKRLDSPYMPLEQVLESAHAAARLGCKEALFTLGEKPELLNTVTVRHRDDGAQERVPIGELLGWLLARVR